jgi:hypothetical protein
MPRDSFGRRSSNWDEEEQGKKKAGKILAQRAWLLIVPLIAIAFYNGRFLVPAVQKADSQITEIKGKLEDQREKTLSEAHRLGVGISALRALSDTFQVRYKLFDSKIDSVSKEIALNEAEVKKLEAEGESLRTIMSLATDKASKLSVLLPPMQGRIDSLKSLISTRQDLVRKLSAEQQEDLDSAKRVMRPELFRKNTALVTGQGDFPNRDALEKR